MLLDIGTIGGVEKLPQEAAKGLEIASKPRDVGLKMRTVGGKIWASIIFHLDKTHEDNVAKYPLFGHITSGYEVLLRVSQLLTERVRLSISLESA